MKCPGIPRQKHGGHALDGRKQVNYNKNNTLRVPATSPPICPEGKLVNREALIILNT